MNRWPNKVGSHSMEEILEAVKDEQWQEFRRSLKGLPTTVKLDKLDFYLSKFGHWRAACVRVDNYINALRRGGQLDLDNNVQR